MIFLYGIPGFPDKSGQAAQMKYLSRYSGVIRDSGCFSGGKSGINTP
jgi:hypothetical protein